MLAITVDSRFPFAVSPECCSCPCFSNGVVSLTLRKRSHRKIVSHSAGHSIFNRQNKKPIHRNIKNQREFFSRFKMMKLCIGSANSETTCLFLTNHTNRQCVNGWCGYDRLPLALPKKSFILFNCCDRYTIILYYTEQMFACQDFTHMLYIKNVL